MLRHLAGLLVLVLAAVPAFASSDCGPVEDADRASHRGLSWADFKGPPPAVERRDPRADVPVAQVVTSLRVDTLGVMTEPDAGGERWVARAHAPCVRAYLLKRLSGRSEGAFADHQLAHEQRHFDLAQIYARRLRLALRDLSARGASAAEAERALRYAADRAYVALSREHATAQRRYDRFTQHGIQRSYEAKWFAQLEARLAEQEGAAVRVASAR